MKRRLMYVSSVVLLSLLVGVLTLAGCSGQPKQSEQPKQQTAPSPDATAKKEVAQAQYEKNVPSVVKAVLHKIKKDESYLENVDKQLTVPQEWVDKAKQEKVLVVNGTMDPPQAEVFFKAFNERYPWIKVDYTRGSQEDRANKTIEAFMNGVFVTDVITSIGSNYYMFNDADALLKISDIPAWDAVDKQLRDNENGLYINTNIRYWGIGYNSDVIKKEDLPKTWDELLTAPAFRNGNLGLGDRPHLWLLPLWQKYGEEWTKKFIDGLILGDLKPQIRKEGMNALVGMLPTKEFVAVIPAAEYRVKEMINEGAPVAWYSPEPLLGAPTEISVLKNAKAPYSAKILINWWLSREGQMTWFDVTNSPPARTDLQDEYFLPFPEVMVGKEILVNSAEAALNIQPILIQYWEDKKLQSGAR